jgi:poly(ADP-ribose) glycohydrolase ARH3
VSEASGLGQAAKDGKRIGPGVGGLGGGEQVGLGGAAAVERGLDGVEDLLAGDRVVWIERRGVAGQCAPVVKIYGHVRVAIIANMENPHPSSAAGRFRAAARRGGPAAGGGQGDDRGCGALLGTFVGDALGMPYEGAPGRSIPAVLEMEDARLGRGTYTDDTQMMIALAESLLRCDVVDPEDLARTIRSHYDPRRGYGAGAAHVLELWRRGEAVERAAQRVFAGAGSLGNGAAMRVAPVAVRFAEDAVLLATQASRSARVTHAHPVGIDGAVVQAKAVGAALNDDDPVAAAIAAARTPELRERLLALRDASTANLSADTLADAAGRITSLAHESVPVAVAAGARAKSFEDAVTMAIRCGGDTDTVGAMAGAIAGARFGAASIPARWVEALEDGERGRRHVVALARELTARAHRAASTAPWRGSR